MHIPVAGASVVPVTALFGGNASGKSNLIDALDDMRLMVMRSHKGRDASDLIPRSPFLLDDHSERKPTRFECSFTLGPQSCDPDSGEKLVYDLEVEFTEYEIRRETLRRSVRHERRSTHTLYARETKNGDVKVDFGVHLQGENQVTAKLTRPNSLFLSAAAQNNHPQLTDVHRWFSQDWHCLFAVGPMPEHVAAEMVRDHQHRGRLEKLLNQAETGIGGIELGERELDDQEIELTRKVAGFIADQALGEKPDPKALADTLADNSRRRLRLLHASAKGLAPLDYGSESRGTKMFLTLILPALDALDRGSLLLIDELDSSIHPRLTKAFVSLFLRPESNPHGAQLIFSTHDVTLLANGLLHQDEIWTVNKSVEGISSLTPLTDFRIRSDLERAYRNGRLGGTPDMHDFFLDLAS